MTLEDVLLPSLPTDNPPSVPPELTLLAKYVLYPFYDWIVQYYPVSWVPNKVTLVGIFATLLASLLLLTAMPPTTLFDPPYATLVPTTLLEAKAGANKARPTPLYPTALTPLVGSVFGSARSMLVTCFLLNALYCVADNTDGRLARRLKKCSHIGEYLDHGLDCVTSLLSACVAMSVMGVAFSNIAVTVVPIAFVTLLSHTLHYERNVFIWGNRLVSIDEAMTFFCVANVIPLLVPRCGTETVSPALLRALLPADMAQRLLPMRYTDVALCIYYTAQYQVVLGILFKNIKMLFRITTIAIIFNSAMLLTAIPYHTAHIAAHGPAGYAWGPFSYVAVWIITTAATSSTIVHMLIHARCAQMPRLSPLPLAGLVFVWLTFPSCPVGGMVIAVVWHVGQILVNVRHIEASARKRMKSA